MKAEAGNPSSPVLPTAGACINSCADKATSNSPSLKPRRAIVARQFFGYLMGVT